MTQLVSILFTTCLCLPSCASVGKDTKTYSVPKLQKPCFDRAESGNMGLQEASLQDSEWKGRRLEKGCSEESRCPVIFLDHSMEVTEPSFLGTMWAPETGSQSFTPEDEYTLKNKKRNKKKQRLKCQRRLCIATTQRA